MVQFRCIFAIKSGQHKLNAQAGRMLSWRKYFFSAGNDKYIYLSDIEQAVFFNMLHFRSLIVRNTRYCLVKRNQTQN